MNGYANGQAVRDEIAFRLVFAHPTRSECDRTLVVWWANGQAVRDQIAFRLVFAHPTRSEWSSLVGKWSSGSR
ncbi:MULTISPECIES: hypothetical protein [unclassified Moorena]|uniref:hypothetical protein n=3 Tax=Moorena TaxID=1155738 RepID=UPI0013FF933D|nr:MULTISPECIES: hypothetical protein [unclassified Moorena]NEO11953.1 hypothetical protein [Moorena sp. SIO3E8]NEP99002.1 hypothetical protein [Moorena sp. SIO3F7]